MYNIHPLIITALLSNIVLAQYQVYRRPAPAYNYYGQRPYYRPYYRQPYAAPYEKQPLYGGSQNAAQTSQSQDSQTQTYSQSMQSQQCPVNQILDQTRVFKQIRAAKDSVGHVKKTVVDMISDMDVPSRIKIPLQLFDVATNAIRDSENLSNLLSTYGGDCLKETALYSMSGAMNDFISEGLELKDVVSALMKHPEAGSSTIMQLFTSLLGSIMTNVQKVRGFTGKEMSRDPIISTTTTGDDQSNGDGSSSASNAATTELSSDNNAFAGFDDPSTEGGPSTSSETPSVSLTSQSEMYSSSASEAILQSSVIEVSPTITARTTSPERPIHYVTDYISPPISTVLLLPSTY